MCIRDRVLLWLGQALGQAATHVIRKGETLGAIAKKYGVTASALASHNSISNPNRVKVGQKINIPAKSVSVTYTVRAGDTLSGIAKKHNTRPVPSRGPTASPILENSGRAKN